MKNYTNLIYNNLDGIRSVKQKLANKEFLIWPNRCHSTDDELMFINEYQSVRKKMRNIE